MTLPKSDPKTLGKFGRYWFYGLIACLPLRFVLDWFDNSTTLIPSHDDALLACFAAAILAGLASAGVAIWQSTGMAIWRRGAIAIALAALGALCALLLLIPLMNIVLVRIDFPPDRTRTYQGLLRISRAYQTHGKSRSWNIQTMPIWSNMDITKEDYDFMLAHRRPGDSTNDPDEISSKGYFCARVAFQEAGDGDALRVMHAGSGKLPRGTVILCPSTQ
jgi:hypothetical protein